MSHTSTRKLLIIDPSISFPEDAGVLRVSKGWPGPVEVRRPALHPGEGPTATSPHDASAVVVLGSRASVHDREPWIAQLSAWLRPIVTGERVIPLLGVCFGHQMVAHLAGAEVGFVHQDRSKLLGVSDAAIGCDRLLERSTLRVVISHGEELKTLPSGFEQISRRDGVLFDGIAHQSLPIFTFQFHPEAGVEFLHKRGVEISELDRAALERDSERLLGAFRAMALR